MMPETLSNSECRYDHENVGWLKTSQVNRRGGVLAPHRVLESLPKLYRAGRGAGRFGGPLLASAAFTVFREIPIIRAIRVIGSCSARHRAAKATHPTRSLERS
jgi:hypothetical protein